MDKLKETLENRKLAFASLQSELEAAAEVPPSQILNESNPNSADKILDDDGKEDLDNEKTRMKRSPGTATWQRWVQQGDGEDGEVEQEKVCFSALL